MFCIKCGEKLDEEVLFCPKCGTKVNGMVSDAPASNNQAVLPVILQPIGLATDLAQPKIFYAKALRVLSVIGFIVFPILLIVSLFLSISDLSYEDEIMSDLIISIYPMLYTIFALYQGIKHKFTAVRIMGIIGTVLHFMGLIQRETLYAPLALAIIDNAYATAFAIVTYVKSKIKPNDERYLPTVNYKLSREAHTILIVATVIAMVLICILPSLILS